MPIIVNLRGPLIPSDVKWVYDFFEIESIRREDAFLSERTFMK